MEIYELEAFLGEIKDDEKVGIMEKHHIVFRSQGGCDFYYNIIELPTGLDELGTERKTAEEIVHLCCPMNRRSEKKLYKRLESAKNYGGKYEPEDAVRAIMGGKLY